jgi:hypothetical protein
MNSPFEVPLDQLDSLMIPNQLTVIKALVTEREDKKSISRLKKQKKAFKIPKKWYIKIFYCFINTPDSTRTIERQYSGNQADIVPTTQSMLDSIKAKDCTADSAIEAVSEKRSKRILFEESSQVLKTQTKGGARTNAGRLKKNKKQKTRKSVRKNKRYQKCKRQANENLGGKANESPSNFGSLARCIKWLKFFGSFFVR